VQVLIQMPSSTDDETSARASTRGRGPRPVRSKGSLVSLIIKVGYSGRKST